MGHLLIEAFVLFVLEQMQNHSKPQANLIEMDLLHTSKKILHITSGIITPKKI